MYNGDDRVRQVDWLREVAGDIRFGGVGDGTPEEQVRYYCENYDLPDWFDAHDWNLLVEMVRD